MVLVLHGVEREPGQSTWNGLIELVGGAAALGFAAGTATGRFRGFRAQPSPGDSRLVGRLRNPSLRMAGAAGVVTHLPGLLYLLGLDAIADGNPPLAEGLLAVLVFDAIWLGIPFCGLIASIRRPDAARVAIGQTSTWMMSHERVGLTLVFAVVGGYFSIKGAINIVR